MNGVPQLDVVVTKQGLVILSAAKNDKALLGYCLESKVVGMVIPHCVRNDKALDGVPEL